MSAEETQPNFDTKEIGRYQLKTVVVDKMHDIRHYLLDTPTGQVWESKLHWMERDSSKPYLLPPASSEVVSK